MLGDRAHAVLSGRGLDDAETVPVEVQLDQVGDVGLVVDDQHRAAVHTGSIVPFRPGSRRQGCVKER